MFGRGMVPVLLYFASWPHAVSYRAVTLCGWEGKRRPGIAVAIISCLPILFYGLESCSFNNATFISELQLKNKSVVKNLTLQ